MSILGITRYQIVSIFYWQVIPHLQLMLYGLNEKANRPTREWPREGQFVLENCDPVPLFRFLFPTREENDMLTYPHDVCKPTCTYTHMQDSTISDMSNV